jgi:hypothetical protein
MKKCPKCQLTKKVHRSHRDAALWLQLLGWHRFRCTQCNLYFEGWKLFPSRRGGGSSAKESEEPQIKAEPKPVVVTPTKTMPKATTNGHGEDYCFQCQSQKIHRAKRDGLMEQFFYPLLSKYPYKCSDCGTRFMKKGRS